MSTTNYILPPTFAHVRVYQAVEWLEQEKLFPLGIEEVAKQAKYSWGWTRRMLNDLEKLGVIVKPFKKKNRISLVPHKRLAVTVEQRDLIKT